MLIIISKTKILSVKNPD